MGVNKKIIEIIPLTNFSKDMYADQSGGHFVDTGICKWFNEAVSLFNDANKFFKKVTFFTVHTTTSSHLMTSLASFPIKNE